MTDVPWRVGGICNPHPQANLSYVLRTRAGREKVLNAALFGDPVAQSLLEMLLDWDSCVLRVEQDYGTPIANAIMALYCETTPEPEHRAHADRLYKLAGGDYVWLHSHVFDHDCEDAATGINRVDVLFEDHFCNLQAEACALAKGHANCARCRELACGVSQIQLPNVKNNAACRLWFLSHTARSALSSQGVSFAMSPPSEQEQFLCQEYDRYFEELNKVQRNAPNN